MKRAMSCRKKIIVGVVILLLMTIISSGNPIQAHYIQFNASGVSFSFDATIINGRGVEQSYSLSAEAPKGWQDGRFLLHLQVKAAR